MEELVAERYDMLPPGQKKVGKYLSSHPFEFSMSTIAKIANEVDTSETTVIRLSYNLGFSSFSQMQKKLKSQFLKSAGALNAVEVENTEDNSQKNTLQGIIKKDIHILQNMLQNLDEESFNQAIELLMEADEVKVGGHLASYSAAHWFYLKMSLMRDHVTFLSEETSPFKNFMEEKKDVVVFLISMPSYSAETLRLAEIAKEQGAKIIVLTDRRLSPVGRIADICLTTAIEEHSKVMISISTVMTYLNLLTSGIEEKYESKIANRVNSVLSLFTREKKVLE
ncbi:MurR/RpiR family transcriptional regulator [Oceanobacillus alkalisoli]|uniref:MurR/RpiR family transcriptional regulator n=1 Tax=Oceanobacillus alkalisoli TaxID=2925113 RepID=UPI001EE497BF|nr:MurR/RpiR family transcriptional regulator [Oceanobacillus alkalisoli]MCG5105377.1 MurR/RpiR family transcriptional regulator [Oceanobacillus alkalisoli]